MFEFTSSSPDFFIQLKGNNAGQPLRASIPNSVGVKAGPDLVPDFMFYFCLYLYQSGLFAPYLRGSVIPYIRQSDFATVFYLNALQLWGKS
jgi:hypothetical protein